MAGRALKGGDASRLTFVGPVRHDMPRGQDTKARPIDLERQRLFRTDPSKVPRSVELGGLLVSRDGKPARVGKQRVEKRGALPVADCRISVLAGEVEEYSPLSREISETRGMCTHDRNRLTGGANLNLVGDKLPQTGDARIGGGLRRSRQHRGKTQRKRHSEKAAS